MHKPLTLWGLSLNWAQWGHSCINLVFSLLSVGNSNPKYKATEPYTIEYSLYNDHYLVTGGTRLHEHGENCPLALIESKGRKQYKGNLHYAKQRNALKISSYCSAYGLTLFIHIIAMNMVGVEETLGLESSA